jgi:DNA-binding Lrp family transcriptional regulator
MSSKSPVESDNQILSLIAEEKEYRQYDMSKRIGKAYRTIMRRIRELESNGLIKLARKEPSEKRGKRAKVYMLTIKGVLTYLSSVSIEPINLVVVGCESQEEVKRRVNQDIQRYSEEIGNLSEFLQFYGEKLNFAIFKEIQWLMHCFQMKTENWAIRTILQVAKLAVSYFSNYGEISQFAENRKKERDRLRRKLRELKKIPISLRKIEVTYRFGSMSKPERMNEGLIDFYSEVEMRHKYAEETLHAAREMENERWKFFFTEQFFREIARFPKKDKMPNAVLHNEVAELLNIKKKYEIAPLEKTLEFFSTNSIIQEMGEKNEKQ